MDLHFCDDCKVQYHDVLHRSCDILDISGNDISSRRPEQLIPKCEKHKELVTWYCEDHTQLGCHECIIEYHRQCEEVKKAKDYLEELTNAKKLEDMVNMLKQGTEAMKSLVKDFDEQIQSLKQNQEVALKSIADLRQRIEEQLNELQKDVTDKLVARYKEEKMTIEASLRQYERLMNGMLNTAKSSVKAVENNNHIEAIVSYLRGQAEIESCKDLIKEMNESFTSVSIRHQVPDPGTQGADMLGRIVIEKQARRFPDVPGFLPVPLIERQVKETGKFNVRLPGDEEHCWIRGIVYLPENKLVVSDHTNSKLKLFTDEGHNLDQLTLQYPRDMRLLTYDTVVVTGTSVVGVRIVKVEDSKLSLLRVININKDLYGITHTDGMFVVSDGGGEVYRLTHDGVTDLIHNYKKNCWYLTYDAVTGDTIVSVYTYTIGDAVVSRLSADKRRHTEVMKVGGVVRGARGIDVDREGNIYVCGEDSHNVVQMSGDGTRVRKLLTSADRISYPTAIAVRGDKFVVSNFSDNLIDRNNIHIFHLQ